jgi:O-antigen/teichoic acid export membrane protein
MEAVFRGQFFLRVFSQAAVGILAFATSAIVARKLGPADNGVYTIATVATAVIVQLTSLGVPPANTHFAASGRFQLSLIVVNSVWLVLVLSGLVLAGAWIFSALSSSFGALPHENRAGVVWTVSLAAPAGLNVAFFSTIVLGQRRFMVYNSIQLLRHGSTLVILLILSSVFHSELLAALSAFTASMVVAAVISICAVVGVVESARVDRRAFRATIAYGLQAYAANLLHLLTTRLSVFLVGIFLGAEAVGQYGVALLVAEVPLLISGSAGQVMFPLVSSTNGGTEAAELSIAVVRQSLLCVIIVALGVWLCGQLVFAHVLGIDYSQALGILPPLLVGVVVLSIPGVLSNDLAGRGRPDVTLLAAGAALIVAVALNLALIPRLGLVGAALSSIGTHACTALVVARAFRRYAKASWWDLFVPRPSDFRWVKIGLRN